MNRELRPADRAPPSDPHPIDPYAVPAGFAHATKVTADRHDLRRTPRRHTLLVPLVAVVASRARLMWAAPVNHTSPFATGQPGDDDQAFVNERRGPEHIGVQQFC